MHSSYSHFSWVCYPDSFKLQPTIQYTHQLRLPSENKFNYYFTTINACSKLPYLTCLRVSKIPIFKLTGCNLTKRELQIHTISQGCIFLHFSPTLGPTLTLGERTKYFCAFPVRSHKAGSHSYRNGYKTEIPNVHMRKTQQSTYSKFLEESSPFLIVIGLYSIIIDLVSLLLI